MDRRQALAGLGSVGLGALLAACTGRGGQPGPTTTARVPTQAGGTATVAPQTATDPAIARLFASAGTCRLTPEQTAGPYYFDVESVRADIREDRTGAPLHVAIRVQDSGGCVAVPNAVIDIWHCDAEGRYSGFEAASVGGTVGSRRTDQKTYLRGTQVTNADGIVEFRTIYPGWYRGRTVHIHTTVHLGDDQAVTTQLYFDEAVTGAVYATPPYNERGPRDTPNARDGLFRDGGASALLTLRQQGTGYLGLITIGVA